MRLGNPIYFTDFPLRESLVGQVSYLKNLGIDKPCSRAFHAPVIPICAVSGSVKHILTMTIPAKVFKKAVKGIAVKVATFHPWRTWTDKGFENESVNRAVKMLTIFAQRHGKSVSAGRRAQDFCGATVKQGFRSDNPASCTPKSFHVPVRPDLPVIRNFISWKIRDWFENLWGCGKVLVSHGVALLVRVASGLEPYSCYNRDAACFFITI